MTTPDPRPLSAEEEVIREWLAGQLRPSGAPLPPSLRTSMPLPRRQVTAVVACLLDLLDAERASREALVAVPHGLTEEWCGRCGRPNVWSWTAPSPLWNAVMRDPATGSDRWNVVCPVCFAQLVEEAGIGGPSIDGARRLTWRFCPTDLDVATLWSDADGRTWDPETWLWVDHPDPASEPASAPGPDEDAALSDPGVVISVNLRRRLERRRPAITTP